MCSAHCISQNWINKWIKHQYYCVMATNWCHKLQVSYFTMINQPLSLWINQTLNPLIVTRWTSHFPKYWTAIALAKVVCKRCDGWAERRFFFLVWNADSSIHLPTQIISKSLTKCHMLSLNNDIMFHTQNVKIVSSKIAEVKHAIPWVHVFNFSFQCLRYISIS